MDAPSRALDLDWGVPISRCFDCALPAHSKVLPDRPLGRHKPHLSAPPRLPLVANGKLHALTTCTPIYTTAISLHSTTSAVQCTCFSPTCTVVRILYMDHTIWFGGGLHTGYTNLAFSTWLTQRSQNIPYTSDYHAEHKCCNTHHTQQILLWEIAFVCKFFFGGYTGALRLLEPWAITVVSR
jgi:hypothetical protein